VRSIKSNTNQHIYLYYCTINAPVSINNSIMSKLQLLWLLSLTFTAVVADNEYGTEVSWPMQRAPPADAKYHNQNYEEFLKGCSEAYSAQVCRQNEQERLERNAAQPALQRNFTFAGYAKVDAPRQSWAVLQEFWDTYVTTTLDDLKPEVWSRGDVYTNHWKAPTKTLLISNNGDDGPSLTKEQRRTLGQEVQSVLEQWSGVPLVPTSVYGIRAYTKGSILAPHIDRYVCFVSCWFALLFLFIAGTENKKCCIHVSARIAITILLYLNFSIFLRRLPLVISAIINVAQGGMEEDWILEVVGHDGIAVNVTMAPGEMVLYESHSVLHGRPYPLNGDYYANIFLHFEPIGYTTELEEKLQQQHQHQHYNPPSAKELFEAA